MSKKITLDKLFDVYKFLIGVTMELQELQEESFKFLNRKVYKDYSLNSKEQDPYALKTISIGAASYIKALFTIMCFKNNNNDDDVAKMIDLDLPLRALMKALGVSKESSLIRVGRGIPSGDEALYAAWQIYPEVRDNIYLVVMRTARYGDMSMFLLEGDLSSFLSPDCIGLISEKTIPANIEGVEEIKEGEQQVFAVKSEINILDFGSLFNELIIKKVMSVE